MKSKIYFSTTHDCTHKCRHCFQDSGPDKKNTTISLDNFEKVINHLPNNLIFLTLTGGEIFKYEENVWSYLKIIKDKNKSRKEKIVPLIQTNGFWGYKKDREIKKILSKLNNYKIYGLDIPSKDKYHADAGLDFEVVRNIFRVNENMHPRLEIKVRGASDETMIFPTGRGRNVINKLKYHMNFGDCKEALDTKNCTIDSFGQVYCCCFNMYKLPGNLIDESLDDILLNAKKDPVLNVLNSQGIIHVALNSGMMQDEIVETIKCHGSCGLCAKLNGLI